MVSDHIKMMQQDKKVEMEIDSILDRIENGDVPEVELDNLSKQREYRKVMKKLRRVLRSVEFWRNGSLVILALSCLLFAFSIENKQVENIVIEEVDNNSMVWLVNYKLRVHVDSSVLVTKMLDTAGYWELFTYLQDRITIRMFSK